MNTKICVLVTGVGGRSVGHQILHALMLTGEKYKIVAADIDSFSYGLYQTNHHYVVPPAVSTHYLPAILKIIEREQVRVVLPGSEIEVGVLAHARNALDAMGCMLVASPTDVINATSNKLVLQGWLECNGFGVPRSSTAENWKTLVSIVGFPIIAKPATMSGGSRGVAILKDEEEVSSYLSGIALTPNSIICQEYVGDTDSEYTVGVLVSKHGTIIDSIVIHRKLIGLSLATSRNINGRSYGISTGYSQGFVERHELLQHFCENLALRLGARGPLNIQCRVSGQEIKVFEVHPRFSGTTSIRADVGFNEPDVMIRHFVFDEEFQQLGYRSNVAVIRAFQTAVVARSILNATPHA
jgi:carbamoyl-phosphate synthase large subunit